MPAADASAPVPSAWPRQPLAGVALCAVGGIVVAEIFHDSIWPFAAAFFVTVALWVWRRALWLCWLLVALGFGTLHCFRQNAVPARALAALVHPNDFTPAREVRAVGRVLDEPHARPGAPNARFTFALESIELDGDGIAHPTHAGVAVSWPLENEMPTARGNSSSNSAASVLPPPPKMGERLLLAGSARNLRPAPNPGEIDYAAQAARRGIRSEIRVSTHHAPLTRVLTPARGLSPALTRAAAGLRAWIGRCLRYDLADEPEVAAVVASMILGLDAGVENGPAGEALQVTGTLHFFAIDGLKIGLLAAAGIFLLRGGVRREIAGAAVVPLLFFYALATGWGPASLRAALIAAVLLGGLFFDRPTRAFNNLGAAAALLLLVDSNQLFARGFQLSFAVVLVILLLAPTLDRRLRPLGAPDPFLPNSLLPRWRRGLEMARRWAVGIVSVSVAAWVGSLPLMLWHFHFVSPISALANILVFPCALAVLGLCLAALAGGWLSTTWLGWMNNANWVAAKALLAIVKTCALVPGGHVYLGDLRLWSAPWREQPVVELLALDLGRRSSALHLRAGRADWLLDTGRPYDYERAVRPALHARGVNALAGLLLRQGDAAHLGAAPFALGEFRPRRVAEPALGSPRSVAWQDWQKTLDLVRGWRGLQQGKLSRGDVLDLSPDLRLRVLYPPADFARPPTLTDDRALVVQIVEAKTDRALALLTADSGAPTERWLLQNESSARLRSAALVLGAHHNGISGTPDFLRAVNARLIVCPFVADAPQLSAEQAATTRLFCLEQNGAVFLRFFSTGRLEADSYADHQRVTLP